MGDLSREEKISRELNETLTRILMEVFSGITKREDALELLAAMKAQIIPAIEAIDKTVESIQKH